MENQEHTQSYQVAYLEGYDFEEEMVKARQKKVLEVLAHQKPSTVLEIGCGPDLLYTKSKDLSLPLIQWVAVEPVVQFVSSAQERTAEDNLFHIIQGFFEKSVEEIKKICPQPFDFIVCSGMLNEVKHPQEFLHTVKSVLSKKGMLHINVPNAGSLHRRLGQAIGVVKNLDDKSERNKKLMQYHVFDMSSLRKTVEDCGLSIAEAGGYFLKPFSHQQMSTIKGILTQEILDGLWTLGTQYPSWATEIFVNTMIKQ